MRIEKTYETTSVGDRVIRMREYRKWNTNPPSNPPEYIENEETYPVTGTMEIKDPKNPKGRFLEIPVTVNYEERNSFKTPNLPYLQYVSVQEMNGHRVWHEPVAVCQVNNRLIFKEKDYDKDSTYIWGYGWVKKDKAAKIAQKLANGEISYPPSCV